MQLGCHLPWWRAPSSSCRASSGAGIRGVEHVKAGQTVSQLSRARFPSTASVALSLSRYPLRVFFPRSAFSFHRRAHSFAETAGSPSAASLRGRPWCRAPQRTALIPVLGPPSGPRRRACAEALCSPPSPQR